MEKWIKRYNSYRKQQKMFEYEGHQIAYIDEGEGEPILLLHGLPNSGWMYRLLADQLLTYGYRVIMPDLLGFGNSDKPTDTSLYDFDLQSHRIVALMEHLEIARWNHCCHDMGGIVTWEIMQNHPGHIKNLLLLNTIVFKEGFCPPFQFDKRKWLTNQWSNLYNSRLTRGRMIKSTLSGGLCNKKMNEDELEGYLKPARENIYPAVHHFFTNFKTFYKELDDYHFILKNMTLPTLVIWGSEDKILQAKQVPLIKDLLKVEAHDVVLMDDVSHYLMEEVPELIGSLMHRFICNC